MTAEPEIRSQIRSRARRVFSRLRTLSITAAIVALAGAAIVLGSGTIANRADAVMPPPEADPVPVAVALVDRQAGYEVTRRFIGRIEPAAEADIAFELAGTVELVLPEEGERVERGEVIARLDTRALEAERQALVAERTALAAQAELSRLTTERRSALEAQGFAATQALDEARLTLAQLEASIAAVEARIVGVDVALSKSVLRAPFAGEVGTRHIDAGATVAGGAPVIRLFSAETAQFRVGLPPALAATLVPGAEVSVETDAGPATARLLRLRPDLDPVTRTNAAIFTLEAADGPRAAFGQTATLVLADRVEEPGFWLPVEALREGPRGSWLVTLLDETEAGTVARYEAVEVIHTDGARVYLRGPLEPGAPVVARGAHRVTAGQRITASEG